MTIMFFEKGTKPQLLAHRNGRYWAYLYKILLIKRGASLLPKNTEEKLKKHLRKTQEKLKCSGSFSSVFFRGRSETYKALYFKHIH